MAKQPRTTMSGKEARYILKQNSVNLAWLAEQIGISPQALNSRLNADVFSRQNMVQINQILKKDIFGIGEKPAEVLAAGSIPIFDIRLSAGYGNGLYDDSITPMEYVSIPSLSGCVGLTIYGDSMLPRYRSGDVVFVRPIQDTSIIDWGSPYVIISRDDRFIKLLYPSDDADHIRLVSANEETRADGSRLYPDNNIEKSHILYIYIRWWDTSDVNRYKKYRLFMVYFPSKPFLTLVRIITQPSVKNRLRAKKTSIFNFSNLRESLSTLALPKLCVIPSHCRGRQFEPDCPYRLDKGFSGNLLIFMGDPD